MVFIDSNIPMYLIGEDHPNKDIKKIEAIQPCLHVDGMMRHKVETLFSFDKGFDSYVGVTRIPEQDMSRWVATFEWQNPPVPFKLSNKAPPQS